MHCEEQARLQEDKNDMEEMFAQIQNSGSSSNNNNKQGTHPWLQEDFLHALIIKVDLAELESNFAHESTPTKMRIVPHRDGEGQCL